jgi:NTP pyrophosphatase (non-canonical NTP hydrolase)
VDLDFVAEIDGFVYGRKDQGRTSAEIEQGHLQAMGKADLVWLHCPGGYVGTSAAMELGFARAMGIRVFAANRPEDLTLSDLVWVSESPRAAVTAVRDGSGDAPSDALVALQSYYARASRERGWAEETSELTLGLLREEIDELEEAIGTTDPAATQLELADVQLYVVHMANILGVDLAAAVRAKERINSVRFGSSAERIAA